ncbi:MAG: hypothetical protein ACYDHF_06235 [Candidatus Cryosericum sp.]
MPGEKEGEFIQLLWDGWFPDALYIRGHIPEKDALIILEGEDALVKVDRYYDPGDKEWKYQRYIPILSPAHHAYGRWSMEPGPDGCTLVLRDYKEPGQGRFKVTRFDVIDRRKEESAP